MTPELMWKNFISQLNLEIPLGKQGKEELSHLSFIGSIEKYKQIFLRANSNNQSTNLTP